MPLNPRNNNTSPAWFMILMAMMSVVLFQGAFIPDGERDCHISTPGGLSSLNAMPPMPDAIQAGHDDLLLVQSIEAKDPQRRAKQLSKKETLFERKAPVFGQSAYTRVPFPPASSKTGFLPLPGWRSPALFPLPPPVC